MSKLGEIEIVSRGDLAATCRTSLAATAADDAVRIAAAVSGDEAWSHAGEIPDERWEALTGEIAALAEALGVKGKSMFQDVGRARVDLGGLDFEAEGGTNDLAFRVGEVVFALIAEIGGPSGDRYLPERGVDSSGPDDTVDDSGLRDLHDTIPEAMYRVDDGADG